MTSSIRYVKDFSLQVRVSVFISLLFQSPKILQYFKGRAQVYQRWPQCCSNQYQSITPLYPIPQSCRKALIALLIPQTPLGGVSIHQLSRFTLQNTPLEQLIQNYYLSIVRLSEHTVLINDQPNEDKGLSHCHLKPKGLRGRSCGFGHFRSTTCISNYKEERLSFT